MTLIKSIFHEDIIDGNFRKPITVDEKEITDIQKFSKEGLPVSFINSDGINENNTKYLEEYIKNCKNSHESIHVAWVCVSEDLENIEKKGKRINRDDFKLYTSYSSYY